MSDQVLLAVIAAVGTIVTSALSAYVLIRTGRIEAKTVETHDLVNGMSHELTAAQVGKATAEGITAGEQAQRDRDSTPNGHP